MNLRILLKQLGKIVQESFWINVLHEKKELTEILELDKEMIFGEEDSCKVRKERVLELLKKSQKAGILHRLPASIRQRLLNYWLTRKIDWKIFIVEK